ncbi:hypothetical protein KNHN1_11890 [Pseudomonas guariconensis]
MIQAFKREGFGKTTATAKAGSKGGGYLYVTGLRRRAILSGLPGSGHPQADGQAANLAKNILSQAATGCRASACIR